jgi:predicted SAM-dependent methyltransferase
MRHIPPIFTEMINKLISPKYALKLRELLGISANQLNQKFHRRAAASQISHYLANHEIKALHIGCQSHVIAGWLNVDITPKLKDIVLMDAVQTFPFRENTFHYVFTEHMIEHVSLKDGINLINESFRVLKPGGRLRISTPDLAFLCRLVDDNENVLHKKYIAFSQRYFESNSLLTAGTVVNNFFTDWGHKYIYDRYTLNQIMMSAGFKTSFHNVMESDDPVLRNLEQHGCEITDEFNRLESMVIEGIKQ